MKCCEFSGKKTANIHVAPSLKTKSSDTRFGNSKRRMSRFVTTVRTLSGEDSAADTPIVWLSKKAPRSRRQATPADWDTQPHRENAPETVRVRVRCLHGLQAVFLPL